MSALARLKGLAKSVLTSEAAAATSATLPAESLNVELVECAALRLDRTLPAACLMRS